MVVVVGKRAGDDGAIPKIDDVNTHATHYVTVRLGFHFFWDLLPSHGPGELGQMREQSGSRLMGGAIDC